MNAIENSRHAPTVAVAIKIADVFHVSVDHLFELDYEGKPANREQPSRFTTGQLQPAAETTKAIEVSPEPAIEEPAAQVSLASLRNVI